MRQKKSLISLVVLLCISAGSASAQTTESDLSEDAGILKAVDWEWKSIPGTSIQTGAASVYVFGGMQSISLARFPLNEHGVYIVNAECEDAETTSCIASANKALAAINGSYFNMRKNVNATLLKDDGRIVPSNTVGHRRHCNGVFRIRGRKGGKVDVCVMTDTLECAGHVKRWREAIVSGPVLLEEGRMLTYVPESSGQDGDFVIGDKFYKRFYTGRHPRTAVGFTRDGWLYFIVVDGRFSSVAEGMNVKELQILAESLGLYEAMNLDGGGSTTLWTESDGVINHPCDNKTFDHEGERTVTNILMVK